MRFHLRCSTRFFAPAERVWAAKTESSALNDEFMPWLRMSVQDPDGLDAGLRGDGLPRRIQGQVWPLGVVPGPAWTIEIVEYEHERLYVDRGESALFSSWEHRHELQVASDAVYYVDAVSFEPRWGPPELVARAVQRLFIHRHQRCARGFDTDGKATAICRLRQEIDVAADGTEGFM
jgi:ligand-binding SRPBCC domain-containing protein